MVSAIFQPEINSLESQVAALQAQIAAAQARIAVLGEAEVTASGALQALQDAVSKISGLAPGAIANLKAAVFNLFDSGNGDSNNDGGNQPVPPAPIVPPTPLALTAPLTDSNGNGHKSGASLGKEIIEISGLELNQGSEQLQGSEPDAEYLQAVEELETSEKLQDVEPAATAPDKTDNYVELVKLSDAVAYMKRTSDSEILSVYVGFKSKTRAEQWGRWLVTENKVAAAFEIRQAKRVEGFKHEIKLWEMSFDNIQRLATLDLSGAPDANTIKIWLGTSQGQEQELVVSKAMIIPDDAPVGISLRQTGDDLLREYGVWAWVIVREKGVPTPKQKEVGRIVEGIDGIEAYNSRGNLHQVFDSQNTAIAYLLQTAGYKMQDVAAALEMKESKSTQNIAHEPKALSLDDIGVGDIVRSVKVKGWQYKVIAVEPSGFFSCERLDVNPPIRTALHPASIELVEKVVTTTEEVEVEDWVEFKEENYQVVSRKGNCLKLQAGEVTTDATVNEVKLLLKKDPTWMPF